MASNKKLSPQKPLSDTPMLKSMEAMSKCSGIGVNTLRDLVDKREIEFIQIGNRRLLADQAIWDWYERAKIRAEGEAYEHTAKRSTEQARA